MRYRFLWLIIACILTGACSDDLGRLEAPVFDVSVQKTSFRVGEPVVFSFTGDQDNISFYSGEIYNDYAFRQGRKVPVAGQGATLEFASQLAGTGTQQGQLSVWLSGNYSGQDDYASVKAAAWQNVTDSFKLATSATSTPSGKLDVSSWLADGKPLYIGFRYITRPQAVNGLARTWWIQQLAVKSRMEYMDTTIFVTDQENAGFRTVDQYPEQAPSRNVITAGRITLLGNVYKDPNDSIFNPDYSLYDPANPIYDPKSPLYQPTATIPVFVPYDPASPYNDPQTETWVISRPLREDTVDLGPDRSLSIKGINADAVNSYSYTYKTPGKYLATFVAYNHNIDDVKTVVKQVELVITP